MGKRYILLLIAVGIMGFGAGLLTSPYLESLLAPAGTILMQKDAYPLDLSIGMHTHAKKDVPEGVLAPGLKMDVIPDPMKKRHYNIHLAAENFRFAPETVSSKAKWGEGHAHLYIDDVLICRIYSPWHHIPALKPGKHEILVTLNLNSHEEYAVAGNSIEARETISVP